VRFNVYGPVPVPRDGHRVSRHRDERRAFWAEVESAAQGLSGACGCYILVLRRRAWYVGLAERQSFKKECFTHHKLLLYNEALDSRRGRPSLLFLAKETPRGRFAKPTRAGHRSVRMLENVLIGLAIRRNRKLLNIRGTKLLREMIVPGVLNTERGTARALPVQALRRSLGL